MSVFGNRVLRIILGYKEEKVTGGCRKEHDEEYKNLYTAPNIIVIKSRKMRRVA
jgi:hypothetical protein